jgi:cytoskeletal protein CcmA (bactofilin family)
MFFSDKKSKSSARIDSLIGQNTELTGDVAFSGGFHIDGKLKGNIHASDDASLLTVSDRGVVEGDVYVPNIILNGTVLGDVHASERVELAANAKVTGNVYYNLIEMAMGAEVNGNLVHKVEATKPSAETAPHAREENALYTPE